MSPDVLDLALILIALPTVSKDLLAFFSWGNVANSFPARLFRVLDVRCDHLLAPASYLSIDVLLVRLSIWIYGQGGLSLPVKGAAILSAALIGVVWFLPLLWLYNAYGWLFWRNPPLYIDKERYFPNSAKLEDPETWKVIRKELDDVLADSPQTRRFLDVFSNVAFIEAPKGLMNGSKAGIGNGNGSMGDQTGSGSILGHSSTENGNSSAQEAAANGWKTLFLRMGGKDHQQNMARMPKLAELLRAMPEVYTAFFSILAPGVSLAPHRGYSKALLRYHLGMIVQEPDLAHLTVGAQEYRWHEGQGVLFDDMFVHSVENRCTKPRIVLFMDIRRPMGQVGRVLSALMEWIIEVHPYQKIIRAKIT